MAWLVGNSTSGYQFVGYNDTAGANTALDPSTCVSDGVCWTSSSIDYVGSDGNDYSAQVQAPARPAPGPSTVGDDPTGIPVFGSAVEGTPVQFDANLRALGGLQRPGPDLRAHDLHMAVPAGPCNLGCLQVNGIGPDYTAPVTTNGVYDYTFPTSGTYSVRLTATDYNGDSAVDTFNVDVADAPPTLAIERLRYCQQSAILGPPLTSTRTINHAGAEDIENVYVDWGDGSGVDGGLCGLAPFPGDGECTPGYVAVPGQVDQTSAGALTLTGDASNTDIAL